MITIIKHGNALKYSYKYKFLCNRCKCVFITDKLNEWYDALRLHHNYKCCPECGSRNYNYAQLQDRPQYINPDFEEITTDSGEK